MYYVTSVIHTNNCVTKNIITCKIMTPLRNRSNLFYNNYNEYKLQHQTASFIKVLSIFFDS